MPVTESQVLDQVANIKKWARGDLRAPHKPLLLLLALARVQRGEDRMVAYRDIEAPLNELLADYSPAGKTSAQYPFWHLQSDGLWEVPERELLTSKRGGTSPTIASLRETKARGGLPSEHHELLRSDPGLVTKTARRILEAHFPDSIHQDLLSAVGLTLAQSSVETSKAKRDPRFRYFVLMAYNWSCAVCGFKGWLDGHAFGVEAAHVRWHSHDGPSTIENGVCLCALHHKALDRGVIGFGTTTSSW